ncbi:hypothetical protein [uncultured Phenylobacterium sp.]|uniref:hypothetical protein n=1 Tax=uncultured Phenylobacterium sp. TaxID=349273 RepID=UPI0025E7D0D2|nr:hypothetical protein [uncultured Phenylobacterium sp.]
MKSLAIAVGALLLGAAFPAAAQAPQIIRGVITDVRPEQISVKPKGGQPVTVALTKDWRVAVTRPITAAEIKPGSFIGSTEMPRADGRGRSLEVHVFPPGVKIGQGHYAWDKRKGAMMTNGTVGNITVARGGRELEVDYGNGRRKVTVSRNIPIVQIADGQRQQVKKGVPVFLIAGPGPGGALVTNAVTVGEGGSAPPM